MNEGFKQFFSASEKDRVDTFLAASQRLGANVQYIEKDFWVCWTLDVLYLAPRRPASLVQGLNLAVEGVRTNQPLFGRHRYHRVSRGPESSGDC